MQNETEILIVPEEAAGMRLDLFLSGQFPEQSRSFLQKQIKEGNVKIADSGKILKINDTAAAGLIATMANSIATFEMTKDMYNRGKVVNVAFAVSAAFVFGDHMGFTAGFAPELLPAMILGKLAGGVSAILVALWMTKER